MQADPEVGKITSQASMLVAKVAELFLKEVATRCEDYVAENCPEQKTIDNFVLWVGGEKSRKSVVMETEGFEFARGLFDGDESPAKAKKAKAGAGAEGGAGAGRKKKKNAPPGKLCVDEIKEEAEEGGEWENLLILMIESTFAPKRIPIATVLSDTTPLVSPGPEVSARYFSEIYKVRSIQPGFTHSWIRGVKRGTNSCPGRNDELCVQRGKNESKCV